MLGLNPFKSNDQSHKNKDNSIIYLIILIKGGVISTLTTFKIMDP